MIFYRKTNKLVGSKLVGVVCAGLILFASGNALAQNSTGADTSTPTSEEILSASEEALSDAEAFQTAETVDSNSKKEAANTPATPPVDPAALISRTEQLYYETDDLEAAHNVGKEALKAAQTVLGKTEPQTLSLMVLLAKIKTDLDLLDEANVLYQTALDHALNTVGATDTLTLKILDSYAEFFALVGELKTAEALYEKVFLVSEEKLGIKNVDTLTRLQNLGMNLKEQGRFKDAEAKLFDAMKLFEEVQGPNDERTLSATSKLALIYFEQRKMEESRTLLEEVIPKQVEVLGSDATETLEAQETLAELYRQQGLYKKAEPLFLEVLKIAEATLGNEDPLTVQATSHTAQLYEDLGVLGKSLMYHRKVYETELALLGKVHPNVAGDINNMASVYRRLGKYRKAEDMFRESLKLMSASTGADSPQTISVMNNLSLLLENQGFYDEAEPLFQRALGYSKKVLGEAHPTTIALTNNLAMLYESQGDFKRSELNYKHAIELNNQTFGKQHPNTTASINNLAYLYLLDQKPEKAEPMFAQAYNTWRELLGEEHQNTMKALNNRGRAYLRMGNLGAAEDYISKATELRTKVFGKRHADTLRSMNDLAVLYVAQAKTDEAINLFKETLALEEEVLGDKHPYTFETLNNLAHLYEQLGNLEDAYKVRKITFERRSEFLNRVLWVAGENTRQSYIKLHKPEQDAYIRLLIQLDDERTAQGIFNISLQRKGLLLKIASETTQVVKMSGSPKLQGITEELSSARKELAALTLSGPTSETKVNFAERVYELEQKVNTLQLKLGEESLLFRESIKPVSTEQVMEALGDSALVDYFTYLNEDDEYQVVASVLFDGKLNYVNLGPLEPIKEKVMELREVIQDEESEDEDVKMTANEAWGMTWEPLTEFIGETESIFLIPDSVLNVMPFDVLTDENESYLIESYNLRLIGSARDLVLDAPEDATGQVMIMAGPDYDSDKIKNTAAVKKVLTRKRSAGVSRGMRMGSGLRGLNFDPLPGAEKEGHVIEGVSVTRERNANTFYQIIAEEQRLREIKDPPEVLHIATHGFFLKEEENLAKRILGMQRGSTRPLPPPGDNPLLRAGLAFAGLNSNASLLGEIDTDNDGVLTAMEILSLNLLGTKLVVLSACETGLGEIHEGEGVYGLRRSFQEAGVNSVINSFWEVSDAGTQELMSQFYDKFLGGMPAREAMREARLEMITSEIWTPYVWSAFVMVGRDT